MSDPNPIPVSSSSATQNVTIRPATYSELPDIASLLTAAFWDDELFGNIIHPHRKQYAKDNDLYWLRRAHVNWWDWGMRYIVSVVQNEETGRDVVTGVALWARIGEAAPRETRLGWADPRRLAKHFASLCVGVGAWMWPNRAASAETEDIIERSYHYLDHMWMGKRAESWYLECLGVRPEFQRQGHGRALVRWGFEQARRENVCVSVISGDGKEGFYRHCGFDTQDGWSGMGEGNPLAIAPGGLMFWKDVDIVAEE